MSDPPSDLQALEALVETLPPISNAGAASGLHAGNPVTNPLSTRSPQSPPARLHSLDDILDAMLRLAAKRGRDGASHVTRLTQELLHAQEYVSPYESGPTVAILDQPFRAAGGWMVQLAERAGGRCILNPTRTPPQLGTSSGLAQSQRVAPQPRAITPGTLSEAQPDFILLSGAPTPDKGKPWTGLTDDAAWSGLRAVHGGQVAWITVEPSPTELTSLMWFLTGWLQNRPEIIPSGVPWMALRSGSWVVP